MRSEAKWQEIDRLLAAVAGFSRANLTENEFVRRVLQQLLQALPCAAAGFWKVAQHDELELAALLQQGHLASSEGGPAHGPRLAVMQQAFRTKSALVAGVSLSNTLLSPVYGPEVADDRDAL